MKFLRLKSDHVKTSRGGKQIARRRYGRCLFQRDAAEMWECGRLCDGVQEEDVIGKERGYNKVYTVAFSSCCS